MKVKMLNINEREAVFSIEGINYWEANFLRRVFMNNVPTLAIEYADIIENDSVINDEVLVHRLSLIPFSFEPKTLVPKEECNCNGKGCSNCLVEIKLKKEGTTVVYSKDLVTKDPSIKPLYDNIIICRLINDMKLELIAYATVGFGEKHPRWQASVCSYVNLIKEFDNKKLKKCWTQDFNVYCVECVENLDNVKVEENKFLFYLESVSGLSSKRIIEEGFEVAEKYLGKIKKAL